MNFDEAIVAHMRWTFKLADYIQGKSKEKLDAKVVCRDDACDLGRWIQQNGAKKSAEFEDLRHAHATFHTLAGSVVAAVDAKRPAEAQTILDGAYLKASTAVIVLIKRLREKAAA
jgi:hypothetical protein